MTRSNALAMLVLVVALVVIGTHAKPVAAAVPQPTGGVGTVLLGGNAGYAVLALGPDYLAVRLPRGTAVRVCGRRTGVCQAMVVNDYGPSAKIEPPRVADIALDRWLSICGLPASAGLCSVTIETFLLPPTDTR